MAVLPTGLDVFHHHLHVAPLVALKSPSVTVEVVLEVELEELVDVVLVLVELVDVLEVDVVLVEVVVVVVVAPVARIICSMVSTTSIL